MMFAGGEESRSDLFEASVASVAFVVRDPCPGVGQVPRSFWFRGTRQIGEQTSHGETVKFRYRSTESFLVRGIRVDVYALGGGREGGSSILPQTKNNAVPVACSCSNH